MQFPRAVAIVPLNSLLGIPGLVWYNKNSLF